MLAPAPSTQALPDPAPEPWSALALIPLAATAAYYLLPEGLQAHWLIQFSPQLLAYLALAVWAFHNRPLPPRLGLQRHKLVPGLRWGALIGLALGTLNTLVILQVVPAMGHDIAFLQDTPHARIPLFLMVPWFICAIAAFVEINFRGFLLGRLAVLESTYLPTARHRWPLALFMSTLAFSFDPFMVATFRHLHWIAVWDGLIWGLVWLKTRNLYLTMIAHAIEVLILYLAVRAALMSG